MARARALLAVLAVALAAASAALADDPTVRINAKDQAKARASLLRLADLGSGWKGGAVKPQKLTAPSCPGFDPKESDLIVTGHAESTFERQGIQVDHDVQVMQKAAFVRTDFARTMKPQLPGCLAHLFQQNPQPGTKVVSARRIAFPRVGDVTAAYRITVSVTSGGQTVRVLLDFVFFGKGRTEHSLSVISPAGAEREVAAFETRLARLLVARTAA